MFSYHPYKIAEKAGLSVLLLFLVSRKANLIDPAGETPPSIIHDDPREGEQRSGDTSSSGKREYS